MRHFIRYVLRRFPGPMAIMVVLMLIVAVLEMSATVLLAPIVDVVLMKSGERGAITDKTMAIMTDLGLPVTTLSLLVVFLVFNALRNAFMVATHYAITRTKFQVEADMLFETYEAFLGARWGFFVRGNMGEYINTLGRETKMVSGNFLHLGTMLALTVQVGLLMILPLLISWQITLLCLAGFAICAGPFLLLSRVNRRWGRLRVESSNKLQSTIAESFGLAKVVLGFGRQRASEERLQHSFGGYATNAIKAETLNRALPLVFYPLGLGVLVVCLLHSQRLGLPFSQLGVLLYALYKAVPLVSAITDNKSKLEDGLSSYEQLVRLRDDALANRQPTGGQIFESFSREVRIEQVTFSYVPGETVLEDVDITIPKGSMVALVGRSGSGKTTVTDLLMGFFEPGSGRVTIDGTLLGELDIQSWRQRLGFVPQANALFDATVRENLLWSYPAATEDELIAACRLANAHEFVMKLSDGYNTVVGDRGIRLSGGQVQRLALARALIRRPEILILDEATSALDTESERLIQQAIEQVSQQTTVVAIAHRLSTIANADRIYVLDAGRVLESGTYQQLAGRDGAFQTMLNQQALANQPAPSA